MAHHRESLREGFHEAGDRPGHRRRQYSLDVERQPAQPLRVAGKRKQHDERDERSSGRDRAAKFHLRQLAGIVRTDPRGAQEHEGRKEEQHRHEIQEPLEDDRGEHGRGAEALPPGEKGTGESPRLHARATARSRQSR